MNILDQASKKDILKMPIRELGFSIGGSYIDSAIKTLYAELDSKNISLKPQIYFSTEWGCLNDKPVISIPFYLVHEKLISIEEEKMKFTGYLEDAAEIARLLRHEAGHAFCYAYRLYDLPRFQEIFGVFTKPYKDEFVPVVGSEKFVRHLEGWYAQKHPDEDFAETFAVLITPDFDWKTTYKGTPAYEKLSYVIELIKEYGKKTTADEAPLALKDLDEPAELVDLTVDDWYKQRLSQNTLTKKILLIFHQEYPKRKAIRDEVVDQIKETLISLPRYSVSLLPINRSVERILNVINEEKPDIIFNLCETFRNNDKFAFNITALLELIQIPFTGSNAGSLFLTTDKYLTKKILKYHNLPHPNAYIIPLRKKPVLKKGFNFPLFVKPIHEDASIGIDDNSFVRNEKQLLEKIRQIHEEIKDDAMVEDYVDGREFFVSVIGNQYPKPLEILELDFSKLPPNKPRIYSQKAKSDESSNEYKCITLKQAKDLPGELKHKLYETSIKTFRAVGASDYARFDLRLDKQGRLFILEVNLNPYLARDNETAIAAEFSGWNYKELINKIVELTIVRTMEIR